MKNTITSLHTLAFAGILALAVCPHHGHANVEITSFHNENEENVIIEKEDAEKYKVEDEMFSMVDEMPIFPGGQAALMQFIAGNIKYPKICVENGIEGKVVVRFLVEKDGQVSNIEVVRSVDRHLDTEAIRVVSLMPKWAPGKQYGKLVRVWVALPIVFRLQK